MAEITIDHMRVEHLPEIIEIEKKVFPSPWSEDVFLQELHSISVSRSFVALADGRVVGYEIAWFVEEEIHLVNIAVAPDVQKQGIGSRLLEHLIETGMEEGRKLITLEVRVSNVGAQALYRSFFFETVGIRERYYSDDKEDAVLMALDLEQYRMQRGKKKWKGPA